MRITIAPKLFLGFVFIIFLNVFFFVIVSNLENVNSMANSLKRQNDIKNRMLRLKTLHRVQAPSIASFERLGRSESVENFTQTQREISWLCDTVNTKLDSIATLNGSLGDVGTFGGNATPSAALAAVTELKSSMEKIRLYNSLYATMFDSIVQARTGTVPKKKIDVWREILDEAGGKLTRVIDSAGTIVDDQTNLRIKEVEENIRSVRSKTIYIIALVTIVTIIFGLLFSNYFTSALRRLTVSAGNIGKGDFNVDPHGYPQDEIGDLASAFFQMSVDLKNAQEALVRSKRLAAIGEVVASVNHEINNPLMIISGNAQFLQMTMNDYPPEMRERVQTILEETERISRVTRKLREIKNPVVEDYTSTGEQMINLDKIIELTMKHGNSIHFLRISAGTILGALTIALLSGCGGKVMTYEQQLLTEADSLFHAGNFEYAKVKYDKIRSSKPASPAARNAQYHLGYINVFYENPFASWEAALREFKLFVSLYPDDARVDEVNSWIKLLTVMQSFKRDFLGTTDRIEEMRQKKTEPVTAAAQKQATQSVDALTESLRSCYHARDSLNQKSKDLENFIIDLEKDCRDVTK